MLNWSSSSVTTISHCSKFRCSVFILTPAADTPVILSPATCTSPKLCHLSDHCQLGESLDTMLRDHLLCGINDKCMQSRLVAEPELTWKKAVQMAQVIESTKQNVGELHKTLPRELHIDLLLKHPQTPRRTAQPSPLCSQTSPSQSFVSVHQAQPPTPCPRNCRKPLGQGLPVLHRSVPQMQ